MIFARLGRFATRYRVWIIIAWVGAAVLVTLLAPNLNDVVSSDTADYLPDGAPYEHAAAVLARTFPDATSMSSTVIVFDARGSSEGIMDRAATDFADQFETPAGRFIRQFVAWLASPDAPPIIQHVDAPTASEMAAAVMVAGQGAEDPALANRLAIVNVGLDATPTEPESIAALHAIQVWLDDHVPAGIVTYQTGGAPLVSDTTDSISRSVDRTIWVTVALVIIMLLLVYRSPVSPLVPLAAVTLAYLITRGLVAFAAERFTIISYVNVLLVVVIYGAGTDYCLFLISRFREEMADTHDVETATAHTVHRVGETITSSAGTIFVGFMAMVFAEMGLFKTTGPSLALGIVLSLLAGLTFVPALLATLGDRAFWPGKATHRSSGRWYEMTSKWASMRPLLVVVLISAVMLPLAVYGVQERPTYELLNDLPDSTPTVKGFRLMSESLGAGNVMPLTVVVTGRDETEIARDIVTLTDQIAALGPIYDVRGLDDPAGQHSAELRDLLHVGTQLRLAQTIMGSFQAQDASAAPDLAQVGVLLEGVRGYLATLGERWPQVTDDPNYVTLTGLLGNPLQLITRQDELAAAVEGLAARFDAIPDAYLMPAALADVLSSLPADSEARSMIDRLSSTYLAENGTAFKLDVVFGVSPSSEAALDTVEQIRTLLKPYQRAGGEAVVSGGAVINADIRATMERDLLRAIGFVLLGIFLVLLIMLRSIVAPLYLIGTVLLSFTFTLGLTYLVFTTLTDVEGLTWYVPFFAFVFLVALGIDYSIFLFGRIKEEVGVHGMREGVHVAAATTGAIITSAGLILAGTFAAMMTGEVMGLREIGFAVAVGVLVDTFVVRTILVPALATLFGRWTWWPGGVPGGTVDSGQ